MTQIGLNVESEPLIDEGPSQPFMHNKYKSGYLSKPYIDYPIHRFFLWAKQLDLCLGGASAELSKLGALVARTGAAG